MLLILFVSKLNSVGKPVSNVFEQLSYKTIFPSGKSVRMSFHKSCVCTSTPQGPHEESTSMTKKTQKGSRKMIRLCWGHDAINCLLANAGHCSLRPVNLPQKSATKENWDGQLAGLTQKHKQWCNTHNNNNNNTPSTVIGENIERRMGSILRNVVLECGVIYSYMRRKHKRRKEA